MELQLSEPNSSVPCFRFYLWESEVTEEEKRMLNKIYVCVEWLERTYQSPDEVINVLLG